MKILLISDTHNSTTKLEQVILPKYASQVQIAIHLGDFAQDLLKFRQQYANLKMLGVSGGFESGETEQVLTLNLLPCAETSRPEEGKQVRILLTHGHERGVKSHLGRIAYYAKEKGVNACFFGHTHEPVMFTESGIFFMNPGSVSEPRGGSRASFGVVTISPEGEFSGELRSL